MMTYFFGFTKKQNTIFFLNYQSPDVSIHLYNANCKTILPSS